MAVAISQTANPAGVTATSNIATYTAVAIGTAADDRIVVVCVATELASSAPSACTIGGVEATAGSAGNFGAVYTQIYYLLVATGTTADIAVTFSATNPTDVQNHICVYKVTGAASVLSASGNDGSTDMDVTDPLTTGSTTIPTNGGFIAVAGCAADTATMTWANATEDLDVDAGGLRFSTATFITAGTATRTCTGTTNNADGALSYVIFDVTVAPTVTTQAVTSIGSTTATGNGTVTTDGGSLITERGVCWNTSTNPTTANSKATSSGTTGAYAPSMTGLTTATHYYVRAYAVNAIGTSYGLNEEFDTTSVVTTKQLGLMGVG